MKNDRIQAVSLSGVTPDHRRIRRWRSHAPRRIEIAGRQAVQVDRGVLDRTGSAAGDVVIAEGWPDGALKVDAECAGSLDDVAAERDGLGAEKDGARQLTGQARCANRFVDAAVEVVAGELQPTV